LFFFLGVNLAGGIPARLALDKEENSFLFGPASQFFLPLANLPLAYFPLSGLSFKNDFQPECDFFTVPSGPED